MSFSDLTILRKISYVIGRREAPDRKQMRDLRKELTMDLSRPEDAVCGDAYCEALRKSTD